ncbi:lipoprotein [Pseudomonadota bacterium]
MKRTLTPFPVLALCCCLTLTIAACGQRGPLYLPDKESPAQDVPAEPAADEESEESDEENP